MVNSANKKFGRKDAIERLQVAMTDVEEAMRIAKAPSISVGIIHEGEIIFRQSFGLRDVAGNHKADSDTSYLIGSCSKMITVAALGILVEEGKLSWDDTIQSHLPTFNPVEDPDIAQHATLFDAARHSTGLASANTIFTGPNGTFSNTAHDHIAMLNGLPTSNSSGQRFRSWWYYNNAAFGVLAQIIETVSDLKFFEFVQNRILEALKLHQTTVSGDELESNPNIAWPYVQTARGTWSPIPSYTTPELHSPFLASMGMRSSVNDMLTFLAAIMNRYNEEIGTDPFPQIITPNTINPLRRVADMWDYWWERPIEDGFENDTAYMLGWYRTTMPTIALGMTSLHGCMNTNVNDSWNMNIIGRESKSRTLYGSHGISNGGVATAYVIPESGTAIVALSNAADACDAADTASKILLQALFDLKPKVDLVSYMISERDRGIKQHESMISHWKRGYDAKKYNEVHEDVSGIYIGLHTSRIDIVQSETAAAGLAVIFANNSTSSCDLEPYNDLALSFLPLDHGSLLARGMIDWDYYKVGIFEFVKDEGNIVGFWWQWDEFDYPGLWVKKRKGIAEHEVLDKFGRFRKS
ncbi:hypothetical protein N7456_009078 [Penicillium angulare]|uniref:Beta-lactamase-related domain-containing protein n=1 Tax=Penicillium angulare TaxID=116970 RepID=A0A9W9F482_9EURO|nr:hypothetical protein N7456_009078 [Penicillium angulare]